MSRPVPVKVNEDSEPEIVRFLSSPQLDTFWGQAAMARSSDLKSEDLGVSGSGIKLTVSPFISRDPQI